jgi:deoxyribodipyrimidine photo-lyase|tara:strand:+ start:30237 stop:31532 length:1296 start_codon:yes stop_codon:yes gene_type:complete
MSTVLHWFRRDLRLADNAALYHALKSGNNVQCIFIFDTEILDKLEEKDDARVSFIHTELCAMHRELKELGSSLQVYYGNPTELWPQIVKEHEPIGVYANKDYEPYAVKRDEGIKDFLHTKNATFHTYKDHVIFETDEILKDDGTPYVVYTPYSRKWKAALTADHLEPYQTEKYFNHFNKIAAEDIISLEAMGFTKSKINFPGKTTTLGKIKNYEEKRNFPAIEGTSRLSVHFRFGTVSIRNKTAKGKSASEKWLNELIWRDFYIQILHHFPHVVGNSFRPKYDAIRWSQNEEHFNAWCEGKTGYGLIDAGMRELNATGFMHNRVRMVVASFLTKHLLLDWRWGEAYFAQKLLDFELASNNGGWQWAAGSGVDAAPYFRIFNPYTQIEKFDKQHIYIKRWVPEWGTAAYPKEIVEHKAARELCLATYKEALN